MPGKQQRGVSNASQQAANAASASPSSKKEGGLGRRPPTPQENVSLPAEWLTEPQSGQPLFFSSAPHSTPERITTLSPSMLRDDTNTTTASGADGGGNNNMNMISSINASEIVARTQHVTIFYQDRIFTWGGNFGVGMEHPPLDCFCVYDISNLPSSSSGAGGNVTSAATTMSSGNIAAAATTITPTPSSTSATTNQQSSQQQQAALQLPPPPTAGYWLSNVFRLSGTGDMPHPASTQFAWCELTAGTVFMFGGWTGVTRTNACSIFSIPEMKWKSLSCSGDNIPPPLTFSTAVSYAGGKRVALYGGNSLEGPMSDVYVLDLSSYKWRLLPSAGCPAKRSSHTATVVRDTLMVVFGGRSIPDLASLSLGGFSPTSTTLHDSKSGAAGGGGGGGSHGAKNVAKEQELLAQNIQALQQQYTAAPLLMNDVGVFDLSAFHWQIGLRIDGTAPPARYGHSTIATSHNVVIFGGMNDTGALLNDLWVLSFDRPGMILWKNVNVNPAIPSSSISQLSQLSILNPNLTLQQQQQSQQQQQQQSQQPQFGPVPAPSCRAGAGFVRLSKHCAAIVGGRTKPTSLVPLKSSHCNFPSVSSVHFLDITRIAEEPPATPEPGSSSAEIRTPPS